MNLQLSN